MALINYPGAKKPYEISAKELQRKNAARNQPSTAVFDRVLEKCYNKIKLTNDFKQEYCFFEFKDFAWGMPIYNTTECLLHVSIELIRKGYKVRRFADDIIFIDWRIQPRAKPRAKSVAIAPKKKSVSFGDNSIYTFETEFVYD